MGLFKKKTFAEETVESDYTEPTHVDREYTPCPVNYTHPEHYWYEAKVSTGVYQWASIVPDLPQEAKDNTVEYECAGTPPKHLKE